MTYLGCRYCGTLPWDTEPWLFCCEKSAAAFQRWRRKMERCWARRAWRRLRLRDRLQHRRLQLLGRLPIVYRLPGGMHYAGPWWQAPAVLLRHLVQMARREAAR